MNIPLLLEGTSSPFWRLSLLLRNRVDPPMKHSEQVSKTTVIAMGISKVPILVADRPFQLARRFRLDARASSTLRKLYK